MTSSHDKPPQWAPQWVDLAKGGASPGSPAGQADPPEPAKARPRVRRAIWLTAVILAAAAVAPVLWRMIETPHPTPRVLYGAWTTTAPKYVDRGFEIWAATVVFRTGPGANDFTIHALQGVDVAERGDSALYTLHFLTRGEPDALSLYYAPGPPARIRLTGQPDIVWSRAARDR
jgi:hypothetical protein